MTKMYIAVREDFPDYMTPTLVAHSVLSAHIKFENIPDYNNWLSNSFRKVVLRVTLKEFEKLKEQDYIHVGHELHTLDGQDSCIVLCPREENHKVLKFAKLWKPESKSDLQILQ